MKFRTLLRAAMLGALVAGAPLAQAHAQTLRISEGRTQGALRVPLNRAIVLESDAAFAESSIANPLIADIATLSDRTVYVLGKLPGRTTLTLLGPDGRLMTNVEVHVTPDIAEFKERLRELLPSERIEVRTANDGIVLSGTVSSVAKLDQALEIAERYAPERVLNLMGVGGTQQVQLKVRFAEMRRTVSKELGASLGISGTDLNTPGIAAPGGFTGTTGVAGAAGALQINVGTSSLNLNLLLEALEEKGVVRTLSEPNLTALSGQTASFLAGGEFPIPQIDTEGNVGVEFKPFGVTLDFTPTVVDGDIINLVLNSEVSSIDPGDGTSVGNGAVIPSLNVRRANSTVELRDGQSFAIAGILQDDFQDNARQVPFLGDLPVLGALFRSADYQRRQTELVIIVTAHLVQPTRGEALALPTDRIRPPTENELFLYGHLSGATTNTRASTGGSAVAAQDFSGNYGYVME
ncbi:type II and III secretion system protein family protein [Jannaschia rubra]|uniref:Pectic enzymes secretion protein OutD n=1 Tax=Jannaschia rubra TaxID=282197 RepID=A0A0M6XSQ9_9RHOB|nr:type II and III secretion system protein family protein [Jannaschia rubra]CTQ33848.1 Pectic enzymes secretion protein OutD [Jannaschia rubra]SFG10738.1 pilus assembly protein CpaC [Jannaschia rubra]